MELIVRRWCSCFRLTFNRFGEVSIKSTQTGWLKTRTSPWTVQIVGSKSLHHFFKKGLPKNINSSGVQYKVEVSIKIGGMVWLQDLFPYEAWPALNIFKNNLLKKNCSRWNGCYRWRLLTSQVCNTGQYAIRPKKIHASRRKSYQTFSLHLRDP